MSLLRAMARDDEDRDDDDDPRADRATGPHPQYDPLPFPPESERIREITHDELSELKKKTRMKLSSRRYTRRRKDDSKAQSATLTRCQQQLGRLQAINATLTDAASSSEGACKAPGQLQQELGVLLEETRSGANQTFDLFARAEHLFHPRPTSALVMQSELVSGIRPVCRDWDEATQLSKAMSNLRAMTALLSDTKRDDSPDLSLSVYKGWRVVECRRRGSRFCVQASKTIAGVSRQSLSEKVWKNADNPKTRVALCSYYARLSVVTSKTEQLDDSSCVFYTKELHEFPAPFQCRSFESIHGVQNDRSEWFYVKHSIHGKQPERTGLMGVEILGIILQDAPPSGGERASGVTVAIVMFYDTHSVSHARQLVCDEPPICHRVLKHWEEHHGLPASTLAPRDE